MAVDSKMMGYLETAVLLQQYGISLPPFQLVATVDEAVAAANSLGYPIVLKGLSADMSHKSDWGMVKLGLITAETVEEAATELLTAVDWGKEATLEGILVQKMMSPGVEMIVGVHHDRQFGPVIALGSGGVMVELLDDVILRLPPLTNQQAMVMIQASKSYHLFQGYRHYPTADVPALTELLVKISHLAAAEDGRLASLDLNPVIVLPAGQGVGVVDIRAEKI